MKVVEACALLAFGALVTFGNRWLIVRWLVKHEHSSMIPFIGGLAGFAGCAVVAMMIDFPIEALRDRATRSASARSPKPEARGPS